MKDTDRIVIVPARVGEISDNVFVALNTAQHLSLELVRFFPHYSVHKPQICVFLCHLVKDGADEQTGSPEKLSIN